MSHRYVHRIWLTGVLLALVAAPGATAATGGLDSTFGRSGRVAVGFHDIAGIATLPDGRIVVASSDAKAVARFTPAGGLDPSFGSGGRVALDLEPLGFNHVTAVALQPDGAVLLAGGTRLGAGDFAVARMTAGGALDVTFGGDGVVTTDIGGADTPNAIAVQADGGIVVAGNRGPEDEFFALARYLPTGALDGSFGTGGTVATAFKGDNGARGLALQPDGAIVAVGDVDFIAGSNEFAVLRYAGDGTLDPAFGAGGRVNTSIGSSASALGVALLPDGRIVVAGPGEYPLSVARYHPDGGLDTSFGSGGLVKSRLLSAEYMLRLADGRLVVAGLRDGDLALARLTPEGAPDRSFAAGGVARVEQRAEGQARGIALQPDGRIVLAGDRSLVRITDAVVLPETRVTRGPRQRSRDRTPTFRFAGTGSSFQCRIDRRTWSGCRSPHTARLRVGRHTFGVRARDAAGNVDPTPAARRFLIVEARRR